MGLEIKDVATTPFTDQKPGTSGLRRSVKQFSQPGYLENFIQSIFNTLPMERRNMLVVGGDGRYFNRQAAATTIAMAVANGFSRIIVGCGALLSTPAVSSLIRSRRADGGIVLSASHNPGGINGDFGIKFNTANGGPAPDTVSEEIFRNSRQLTRYFIAPQVQVNINLPGEFSFADSVVEVVDPVADYRQTLEHVFDFDRLREGFAKGRLSVRFDAMHAITGPYARELLEDCLGACSGSVVNAEPREDFGGQHPDPNLGNAKTLVGFMAAKTAPLLGAASDGDGDRNLILGRQFFVTPSDSLAVIAEHANAIPQFRAGLAGVARSMPTSRAVDRVAAAKGIDCFETPTGWKFFSNLFDAGKISLCGEESFGTGGDHLREKDGLWTVLVWLSILAETGESVSALVQRLWHHHGRFVYSRHDFDHLDTDQAAAMMMYLSGFAANAKRTHIKDRQIVAADVFRYIDPVDHGESHNQGIRLFLDDDVRLVYRLSGTGTAGATLRIYIENYLRDNVNVDARQFNRGNGQLAADIARIEHFTGVCAPSLVT